MKYAKYHNNVISEPMFDVESDKFLHPDPTMNCGFSEIHITTEISKHHLLFIGCCPCSSNFSHFLKVFNIYLAIYNTFVTSNWGQ